MKNKKGFTLVELIVSFALITTVSLTFFKTILSLQEQQLLNIAKNKFTSFKVIMNNSIQQDFMNDKIEKIISCGDSCYDITYEINGIVRLSVDVENNIIIYGNIKEKIPSDYKLIGDIKFSNYISDIDGIDSFIALNMNLKSNYENKIENIKYVYQYDISDGVIELDVDGAEASDIIEYLLYSLPEENGLYEPLLPDGTSTGIRYRGSNPNNYVYFNCEDNDASSVPYGEDGYDYASSCEIWRIIGVFDVDNGKGNIEKRVKLVKGDKLVYASWDSSDSTINNGWGINQWGASKYSNGDTYEGADIMRLLNGYYIGIDGEECLYCTTLNESTCSNDCSATFSPLSNISLQMIEDTVWYTGALRYDEISNQNDLFMQERGERGGNDLCTSKDYACNDGVIRTTKWVGKIGLIYLSDYVYASPDDTCHKNLKESQICTSSNWFYLSKGYFRGINPVISANYNASSVSLVSGNGTINSAVGRYNTNILPSLYLNSNVTFVGNGNGTEDSPYILGIKE